MTPTILFTGYPGFIGARLIPKLLAANPGSTVVALVEPRMVPTAEAAAPEGVVVEPGDITVPRLGLSEQRFAELAASTTAVFHLAAIYDLAVPFAVAQKVNVFGTQNVLEFCRACTGLERLNYVSTCYVAGDRTGTVLEAELAVGQNFKNHYESTKFAAEVHVRAAMHAIPTTIYRPAIVVGDSATGVTTKFDGPYYLLRALQKTRPWEPVAQLGSKQATFNVVPVDFVIDAIAAGAASPDAGGETFQLSDPQPVSSAELMNILARAYGAREPSLPVPSKLLTRALKLAPVRRFYGNTPWESLIYLRHPVTFDPSRTTAVLGLACPRLVDYAPALVDFFRAHQDDPAF